MASKKTVTRWSKSPPHAPLYDREPSEGMSLQEAYDRFVDPKKMQAIENAQAESDRDRNVRSRTRTYRVLQAWGDANADFSTHFMNGSLIAWGAEDSPIADRKPIPPHAWQYLRPRLKSDVLFHSKELKIYSVRVYEAEASGTSEDHYEDTDTIGGLSPKAKLRRELREWLEKITLKHLTDRTKAQYLAMARGVFGPDVTENLFNFVWRNADLPHEVKAPGARRKPVF